MDRCLGCRRRDVADRRFHAVRRHEASHDRGADLRLCVRCAARAPPRRTGQIAPLLGPTFNRRQRVDHPTGCGASWIVQDAWMTAPRSRIAARGVLAPESRRPRAGPGGLGLAPGADRVTGRARRPPGPSGSMPSSPAPYRSVIIVADASDGQRRRERDGAVQSADRPGHAMLPPSGGAVPKPLRNAPAGVGTRDPRDQRGHRASVPQAALSRGGPSKLGERLRRIQLQRDDSVRIACRHPHHLTREQVAWLGGSH